MANIKSESTLSFFEATSIIVGHGVGAGILAVPYLAAHNSVRETLLILLFCYAFNLLLHLLIAELSYNNDGAQFISCFDREMFSGKFKKIFTWLAFALLGLSVVINVSAFLTGAAEVFDNWFGLPREAGMLLFYALGAGVVFFGLKLVGVCEKYAVAAIVLVVGILLAAALKGQTQPLPSGFRGAKNALALFGVISFSLSAVMSTPQVVKGLRGDKKRIRGAIALGLSIIACLILLVTFTTLLAAGEDLDKKNAMVNLSASLGGWARIVGYLFTFFALATSFWANTLNLRDIVHEQTKLGERICWLLASVPCLLIALFFPSDFVDLARIASIIQVVTGLGIIMAYNLSRKRTGASPLVGKFGALPFQILVLLCTLAASVGAVLKVS